MAAALAATPSGSSASFRRLVSFYAVGGGGICSTSGSDFEATLVATSKATPVATSEAASSTEPWEKRVGGS